MADLTTVQLEQVLAVYDRLTPKCKLFLGWACRNQKPMAWRLLIQDFGPEVRPFLELAVRVGLSPELDKAMLVLNREVPGATA